MTGYERTSEDAVDRRRARAAEREKEREREQVSRWERMAIGIPRTFTASQFFRLIIQRARMRPGSLGDCI